MKIQELLATLTSSKEPDRRRSAALELADAKELQEGAIRALARGLSDEDKGVRDVCAYALGALPNQAVVLKAQYIAPLITHKNIEIRNLAGEVLVRLGAEAADVLLHFLTDPDPDTRKFACDVIILLGNSSDHILQNIAVLVDDPDSNVRSAAVDALGRLGATQYLPLLLDLYDNDEEMQPYIIQSLGFMGGEQAQAFLLQTLTFPDEFLQVAAIDALALCGNDISIALRILEALPEATEEIQLIMLRTIFGLSYRLSSSVQLPDILRPVAHKALIDSDEEIRIAGLFALGSEIQQSDVSPLLEFVRHSEDTLKTHVLSLALTCSNPAVIEAFFLRLIEQLDSDSLPIQELLLLLPSVWERAAPGTQANIVALFEREICIVNTMTRQKLTDVMTELGVSAIRRMYTI